MKLKQNIQEKIFIARLNKVYEKATLRELQLVIQTAGQEIERRNKK